MNIDMEQDYAPQQETLFENSYTRTKESFQELYSYQLFKRPARIVMNAVLTVLTVVLLFLGIWLFLLTGEVDFTALAIVALLTVYLVGLNFYLYSKSVKVAVARDNEICPDGAVSVTTTITENELFISCAHTAEKQRLTFAQIKEIVTTKNYLLLFTNAQLVYFIAKSGFTKGTYEDLCDFLRAKGMKIKK